MSKSNALESGWLRLLFGNEVFAGIGDATGLRGSTSDGYLWFSLHTASPGDGDTQTLYEVSYGGYARVAKSRAIHGSYFNESGGIVSLGTDVTFPVATSGSGTITHFGIGADSTGSGYLLYSGALTGSITYAAGVKPVLVGSSLLVQET